MRLPNFEVVADETDESQITLRDLGPHSEFPTITNAAEALIKFLANERILENGRKLLYYDSEGDLDQLHHWEGRFVRFASNQQAAFGGS
jgi:hypothetical protein